MAVYSMTGYASASLVATSAQVAGRADLGAAGEDAAKGAGRVNVELRSVNGRFLDLGFRLPDELRSLEPALRELLGATFRRGKIELRMTTSVEADSAVPLPRPDQLNRLALLESTVQGWLPKASALSVHEVLIWCKGAAATERFDDAALQAAKRAIQALQEAREREGARLAQVLLERTRHLRELAARAEPLIPDVVQRQQERFVERWREALAAVGAAQTISAQSLHERAVNEAAAYAIRIDVAEELARLRSHLDEVQRLLGAGGEVGKRLDFLIQELLREANTLGSKAASLALTNVAVEKMREQVQNIE
jgi:uncharacterized protein (TIGR00255 family)